MALLQTRVEPRGVVERCANWWAWLCRVFIILTGRQKGGDPCIYVPERVINRPDPCLYSQFLLMQLDQPVTWDNPDVAIFLDGHEQYTYDLRVDTEYDIVTTVHNSSREKAATGTRVEIRWIEFGAGAQIRHPIDSKTVDVPPWPGVETVETTWRTPASPGHYCIEVELSHPNDGNPSNNRGWNNTQVKAAASEVRTPIRIFNRWPDGCPPIREGGNAVSWVRVFMGFGLLGVAAAPVVGTLALEAVSLSQHAMLLVAGYLGGSLLGFGFESVRARVGERRADPEQVRDRDRVSCNLVELTVDSYTFEDETGKDADPDAMFAERPPAWPAKLEPSTFVFQMGEAYRDVELVVDAPDEPGPSETFNVSARQGGVASGGVTVTVTREEA